LHQKGFALFTGSPNFFGNFMKERFGVLLGYIDIRKIFLT
jgi:hypothetical protein